MPLLLCVATRAVRRPSLTQRPHRVPQAYVQKTAPSGVRSRCCSPTWSAQRRCRRAWTLKTFEVISVYQKCVAEIVQRFGGFVAKYMGDGVLVYFGFPTAHEDDAERAVRAGLELVAALGALKTHAPLQTRVGIATGLVVVGDMIGSGSSQEQAIVGETPNIAARLQGITEP